METILNSTYIGQFPKDLDLSNQRTAILKVNMFLVLRFPLGGRRSWKLLIIAIQELN